MKYEVESSTGENTTVDAGLFQVIGGALVFVRIGSVKTPFFAIGAGEWKSVKEVGESDVVIMGGSGTRVDPTQEAIVAGKPPEPSVLTRKLKAWVKKARDNTPSHSFPFDSDLVAMIEEAEGGRKTEVPPKPKLPEQKPPGGKLD